MKVVCNTSPIIWLRRVGRLDLLPKLYETIYTTPKVLEELTTFRVNEEFVRQYLQIPPAVTGDLSRFHRLVKRSKRKLDLRDVADVEVFVTYSTFTDAEEMLFANKGAETKIGSRSIAGRTVRVRDISHLYVIAEEKKVFDREASINYLESLLRINYRRPYIEEIRFKLGGV